MTVGFGAFADPSRRGAVCWFVEAQDISYRTRRRV